MATYKRRRSIASSRPFKRHRSKMYKRRRFVGKRRYRVPRRLFSSRKAARKSYGFGDSKVVYCKWFGMDHFAPQADAVAPVTLNSIMLNSIYDPYTGVLGEFNVTSAGYKLYSKIYARYIVLGAKLVTTFRCISKPTKDLLFKPFVRKARTTGLSTALSGGGWAVLQSDPDIKMKSYVTSASSPRSVTIVQTYSPRKEFGVKDPRDTTLGDQGIAAAMGYNPSKAVYATAGEMCADQAAMTELQNWSVEYRLYQKVLFFDRDNIGALTDDVIQDLS